MREVIMSVGIDIGTSTTQLIFSRLTIENLASSYTVPRISIVEKEVTYRSEIYFTPLLSDVTIDAEKVKKIVQEEYKKAGVTPGALKTGAVIITGETARKQNANLVLQSLSHMAGDFVVATAGPDLESVLSAKGAGADKLAKTHRITVANLDVGGGTSNIAVFNNKTLAGTSCLDIGGRLIKIAEGKINYIFPKIKTLAEENGIHIEVGEKADEQKLKKIAGLMADQLAEAIFAKKQESNHNAMYTNKGKPLNEMSIDAITFSGGVADCMGEGTHKNPYKYGDIGILLGEAIYENPYLKKVLQYKAEETIRATVVGAGTHTTNVSGSTIHYVEKRLPIKNIPIIKISKEEEGQENTLVTSLERQIPLYKTAETEQVAIALSGDDYGTFVEIQNLAEAIIKGANSLLKEQHPLIIILENDIGKALGNAINVKLNREKEVICLDGVFTQGGDYIDIGEPVAGGRVLPVVTKTMVFNS